MSDYTPSATVDSLIADIASFITPFVGDAQIIRGQANRVPAPLSGWVELTEINTTDISTPITRLLVDHETGDGSLSIIADVMTEIQVDLYGPQSGDWCRAIKSVFRTPYTSDRFTGSVSPLYCDDGRQQPLIGDDNQYITHWMMLMKLQYNPIISIPQQYFTVADITIIPV